MYNCITYENKRRINFCPAELRYSLKGLHWYPVSTALLPKRPYSEDMWNTTIIRWDFLLDLRTFSGVVCKKVFFFCRHQKLEVRFFWSMSFGCGSVFFFSNIQVTKFSPSPKLLGRWIFLYQNAMILIQSRGGGNSSNLKTPGLSNLSVPRAPWGWICPILLQLACLCGSIWPWMPKNEEEQRWHGTKLEVLMLWSWQRTIVH